MTIATELVFRDADRGIAGSEEVPHRFTERAHRERQREGGQKPEEGRRLRKAVHVAQGAQVAPGQALVEFEAA